MTKVKICGLTTRADAVAAHEAGADYLGLIFAASARRVSRDEAQLIRAALPDTALVGVFLDQPLAEVLEVVADCGLDLVQLHGAEDDDYVRAVQTQAGCEVIKAVRAGEPPSAAAEWLLFDLPKGRASTDEDRDRLWEDAKAAVSDGRAVFLAGKLVPEDVADALGRVGPQGLDLASGVESVPGRKDPALMRRFIEEVGRARS